MALDAHAMVHKPLILWRCSIAARQVAVTPRTDTSYPSTPPGAFDMRCRPPLESPLSSVVGCNRIDIAVAVHGNVGEVPDRTTKNGLLVNQTPLPCRSAERALNGNPCCTLFGPSRHKERVHSRCCDSWAHDRDAISKTWSKQQPAKHPCGSRRPGNTWCPWALRRHAVQSRDSAHHLSRPRTTSRW